MTVKNAGPVPWRGWGVLFWVGLTCWVLGFVWHWSRPPSLWLLDVPAIPLMALLYWFGFVAVVVAVVGDGRWAEVLTLVPVLIVITALVNPAWRFAPRTWFILHRPLFEMALATDPGHEYYGNQLPPWLRFLSSEGKVSNLGGSRFFPQWGEIPDDAGGYLYSPFGSPEVTDLYGMDCKNPVDLGGGWWMCGLADSGL